MPKTKAEQIREYLQSNPGASTAEIKKELKLRGITSSEVSGARRKLGIPKIGGGGPKGNLSPTRQAILDYWQDNPNATTDETVAAVPGATKSTVYQFRSELKRKAKSATGKKRGPGKPRKKPAAKKKSPAAKTSKRLGRRLAQVNGSTSFAADTLLEVKALRDQLGDQTEDALTRIEQLADNVGFDDMREALEVIASITGE